MHYAQKDKREGNKKQNEIKMRKKLSFPTVITAEMCNIVN